MHRDDLIARLARLVAGLADGTHTPDSVLAALGRMCGPQAELPLAPSPRPASSPADAVLRLFHHWRMRTGRATSQLTPERARVLRRRLADGYTEADIKRAIDGCAGSDFHSGNNDRDKAYNDLTLICRTGSKLEDFIQMAAVALGDEPPEVSNHVERLRALARVALQEGKTDEYNRLQEHIRAVHKDR